MGKSKIVNVILAVVILVIGIACGIILSRAQFFRREGHRPFGYMPERGNVDGMLQKFCKHLNLTAEQKEKIKVILEEQKKEMDKVLKDVHPKIEAQMDAIRGKIRNILDDKQKVEYDKMIEKFEKREKKHDEKMEKGN
ncbi:MAG: hypothetical protein PHE88_03590 [Elusimicrobia bacterium]|nr:hypothetical protein [Elusimicrobiota bacterium]